MLECPWIRGALSLAGSHQPRHTPFQSNLFRKRPPFIKSQPLQTTGAFNKTPSMFRRPPPSALAEQGAAIIATTFHSVQPLRRGGGRQRERDNIRIPSQASLSLKPLVSGGQVYGKERSKVTLKEKTCFISNVIFFSLKLQNQLPL